MLPRAKDSPQDARHSDQTLTERWGGGRTLNIGIHPEGVTQVEKCVTDDAIDGFATNIQRQSLERTWSYFKPSPGIVAFIPSSVRISQASPDLPLPSPLFSRTMYDGHDEISCLNYSVYDQPHATLPGAVSMRHASFHPDAATADRITTRT